MTDADCRHDSLHPAVSFLELSVRVLDSLYLVVGYAFTCLLRPGRTIEVFFLFTFLSRPIKVDLNKLA